MLAEAVLRWQTGIRRMADWLEQHSRRAIALALLSIFYIALGVSAQKPLWYDELITVKTAALPTVRDVWKFYAQGLDTTGPVPSLFAHAALKLPFGPELDVRLPFTIAYLVMVLCLYGFVRRRYAASYALICVLLCVAFPFFYYATEARAYALMLGGAGLALFCWQSAMLGRHRRLSIAGIWLGLAGAFSAHIFAIFLFVPLAGGQLIHDRKRRRVDWPVWLALVLFPVSILPIIGGERLAAARYQAHFWKPHLELLHESYLKLTQYSWMAIAVLLLAAAASGHWLRSRGVEREKTCDGFTSPEWVAAALLALMPFYALPASFVTGVYALNYVVALQIGCALCLTGAAAALARRGVAAGFPVFAILALLVLAKTGRSLETGVKTLAHPGRVHQQCSADVMDAPWLQSILKSSLPIAFAEDHTFSQVSYYGGPALRSRFYFLTDVPDSLRYPLSVVPQTNFLTFSKALDFNAVDLHQFMAAHPQYLAVGGGMFDHEMLMQYLQDRQREHGDITLQLLATDFSSYLVVKVSRSGAESR